MRASRRAGRPRIATVGCPLRSRARDAQTRLSSSPSITARLHGLNRETWTERAYADSDAYLAHRARAGTRIGPLLVAGDALLDLACGDGAFAEYLPAGVRYSGVDASKEMADAARARGHDVVAADFNEFAPPQPVAVTTCFRAIYYARDRRAFFRHVAAYTQKKFVFDLNPRQYGLESVIADLRSAG